MDSLTVTTFAAQYWPLLFGVAMFVLGALFGVLLNRLSRSVRSRRDYRNGWNAGYQAHKDERREIAARIREARRARDDSTRVLPSINTPRVAAGADQTVYLHNPRRNP